MTRPASVRPLRAFVGKNKKAGSKPLEIDWDRIDDSYNHRANDYYNRLELKTLRNDLADAEARGAYSKARKVRREISRLLEANLALSATFCQGDMAHLSRCKCRAPREVGQLHPNTIRAIARKEEKDLADIERIGQELRERIKATFAQIKSDLHNT